MSDKKVVQIRIYGASDDLIEIDGDFREEFSFYSDDPGVLALSDGTLLQMQYAPGIEGVWKITPLHFGSAEVVEQTIGHEGGDIYSDTITLKGVIEWIVLSPEADKYYKIPTDNKVDNEK